MAYSIDNNKIIIQEINNFTVKESDVKSKKIAIIINKEIFFKIKKQTITIKNRIIPIKFNKIIC